MTGILWVPAILSAIAVGLAVWVGASALADLVLALLSRRWRGQGRLRVRGAGRQDDEEVALYGLPRNMAPWMIVSALGGLLVAHVLLGGVTQMLGLTAGLIPMMYRRRKRAAAEHMIRRQVGELIQEMQLQLAFGGSLGAVLDRVANAADREGIVYERLRQHRHLLTIAGPNEVLERLATELRSPELELLVRRIRTARRGSASFADVLRAAAEETAEELRQRAEQEVEGAPLRLVFPMLIGLLPPILVLVLYPPAYGLVSTISGAGPSMIP